MLVYEVLMIGIFEVLQVALLICWKNVRIVKTSYISLVFICLINSVIENYRPFDASTELRWKRRLRPKNILSWVMMLPLKSKFIIYVRAILLYYVIILSQCQWVHLSLHFQSFFNRFHFVTRTSYHHLGWI